MEATSHGGLGLSVLSFMATSLLRGRNPVHAAYPREDLVVWIGPSGRGERAVAICILLFGLLLCPNTVPAGEAAKCRKDSLAKRF